MLFKLCNRKKEKEKEPVVLTKIFSIVFPVPAGLRYQERDIAKFQGENIPSKTFKYLQYITQEELALEEQEKKNRVHTKPEEPEIQPMPMRPIRQAQSVSSLALNLQDFTSTPLPKPTMNGPINFGNSALNKDRSKANSTSITLSNLNPNSSSIFDIKPNYAAASDAGTYPLAPNHKPPSHDLPVYSNVPTHPTAASTFSINTEQVAVLKEETNEPVECSFLPSSCNETTFKFNNISDNSSSQAPAAEIKAPGKEHIFFSFH